MKRTQRSNSAVDYDKKKKFLKELLHCFITFLEEPFNQFSLHLDIRSPNYQALTSKFHEKVRFGEVGENILFPSEVETVSYYFEQIASQLPNYISSTTLLEEIEDDLVHEAIQNTTNLRNFKKRYDTEQFLACVVEEFVSYFSKRIKKKEQDSERLTKDFELKILPKALKAKFYFNYPPHLLHEVFTVVWNSFRNFLSSNRSLSDYVEMLRKRVKEKGLEQEKDDFELISTIIFKFYSYLVENNRKFNGLLFDYDVLAKEFEHRIGTIEKSRLPPESLPRYSRSAVEFFRIIAPLVRDGPLHGECTLEEVAKKTFASEITKEGEDDNQSPVKKEVLYTLGQHVRTYKVGLRAPKSLLELQNRLIKDRKKTQLDQLAGKNRKRNPDLELVLKDYRKPSFQTANQIYINTKNIIRDSANPSPQEITLHDYQYLANASFKMLCEFMDKFVKKAGQSVPTLRQDIINEAKRIRDREGLKYSDKNLNRMLEKSIELVVGSSANLAQVGYKCLAAMLEVYYDLRGKVESVRNLLSSRFSDAASVLLAYYSVPNNLLKYLASSWSVQREWVRNTLVGWRRKIDPFLPTSFQIESLSGEFLELAKNYHQYCRNKEDIAVVSILQKRHILHLLPNQLVNLSPLLDSKYWSNYHHLKSTVSVPPDLAARFQAKIIPLDLTIFTQSADKLIADVKKTMGQFAPNSTARANCQMFVNKITYIKGKVNSPEVQELLKSFVAGNRYARSVERLLRTPSVKRLFTALRGIASLTLAQTGLGRSALGQFTSAFNPDSCLTHPFSSAKRKKKHLPIELQHNKFYVQIKDDPNSSKFLNANDITAQFKINRSIWISLPVYTPDQRKDFEAFVNQLPKLDLPRIKGRLWFLLVPSKKILECVKNGATVNLIRLNVPQGPTQKIVADVVLSSNEPTSFSHRGAFTTTWDKRFPSLKVPTSEYLGVDFNRISKYMVATANPDQEIDISLLMDAYEKMHGRLEQQRKYEIPNIQRKLDGGYDWTRDKKRRRVNKISLSPSKAARMKVQVTLDHQKRARRMKEGKRQALIILLYMVYKSGAKYVSWDSLEGVTTRGKGGALATAITYLPKRKAQFELFREWVEDLRDQKLIPRYQDTIAVSPYTSQNCGDCIKCTGSLNRMLVKGLPYDEFQCSKCGKRGNRHSNAAQVAANLLRSLVQSRTALPP